ncbi:MAG TPA: tetratricopeptide repeat protein [Phaeodactylibacter sp.]|nr:tetratricopeptide repeat protein [Phaeodactylibacter sp.]
MKIINFKFFFFFWLTLSPFFLISQVEPTELYANPIIQKIQDTHAHRKYKEAETLADAAMKKFRKENNHKDYCEAIYLKAKVIMHQYRIEESLMWYDSCANYAKAHELNFHYASALLAEGDILNYQNKSDAALVKSQIVNGIKNLPQDIYATNCTNLSTSFLAKGMVDSADYYTLRAFQIDSIYQLKERLGASHRNLARMYARRGKNNKAITLLLKALYYFPEKKQKIYKVNIYGDLSDAFYQIHNLHKAKEYALKYKDSAEEFKLKSARAVALFKLGTIAETEGKYHKAIQYYEEALERFKNSKNKKWWIGTNLGLAKSYMEINQPKQAKLAIEKTRKEVESSDNEKLKLQFAVVNSMYNSKIGNHAQVFQTLKKAEQKAIEQKNLFQQRDIYKTYVACYKATGRMDLAFSNLEKYHQMNDSISQIQQTYLINDLDSKYQKVEQDLKIQKLDADKIAMNQQISRRNITILIGSFFLLFGAAASFIIFNLYKKNKEKKLELFDKNKQLTKALNEKSFLLKEIHHRVKNNLQIVSSLLSLQARNVEDQAALDALKEGQSRVRSMALIHQNLYQDDDLIGVEAKAYIEKLSEGLFHSYKIDHEKIAITSDIENIKLDVNTIIPLGLIINELITNALKYAFEKNEDGNIHLTLKEEKENLVFMIKDNGIGLPSDFSIKNNTSLGYRLIKAFSKKLNAVLDINGTDGTKITLTFAKK